MARALELLMGPQRLGEDPDTDQDVFLDNGRYGWYVQLGEGGEDGEKPKRKSVPRGMAPPAVDLSVALALLNLPREAGLSWRADKFYQSVRRDPEPPSVTVPIGKFDPLLGRSYLQLAMESRSQHRSQAMGSYQPLGPRVSGLRLVKSHVHEPTHYYRRPKSNRLMGYLGSCNTG